VDDEAAVREVLLELLGETGECVQAASAEEALALLRERAFDLILTDITMDSMTGLEMVRLVLQIAPLTGVIILSGEQTVQNAIEALRVGAFDYITKPFDLPHVEAAVKRATDYSAPAEYEARYGAQLKTSGVRLGELSYLPLY
jgi:DNA-binding NtrC family response regulator